METLWLLKGLIIFISVLDPSVSTTVSILLPKTLKWRQVIYDAHYTGNLLKFREASSISEKRTISPIWQFILDNTEHFKIIACNENFNGN